MHNEDIFPFTIYYYPLINVKVKDYNKKTHYYQLSLDSSRKEIWYLPDNIITSLPEKINYSVQDNNYIRNDKIIALLQSAVQNNKPVSCFFMDSEESPYSYGEGRFKILSLGNSFEQCNCHDPYSPINKNNKVFLNEAYLKAIIPLNTKKDKKIIKF